MCFFCELSNPIQNNVSNVESTNFLESVGWIFVGGIWLIILYQMYRKFSSETVKHKTWNWHGRSLH